MRAVSHHTIRRNNKKQSAESPLLNELRSTMKQMGLSDLIASLNDGELYICSMCDLPVKVCQVNPSANCPLKVRQNTQLDLLRQAYKNLSAGTYGCCAECGKQQSSKQLKLNPLQELCSACRQRAQKKQRKILY